MREIKVKCSHCGAVLGRMVENKNRVYLDAGGWLIERGKKHCHVCGSIYNFVPPKRGFDNVAKKASIEKGGLVIS